MCLPNLLLWKYSVLEEHMKRENGLNLKERLPWFSSDLVNYVSGVVKIIYKVSIVLQT